VNTRAILIGGIAANLVIAMWEMIVEAVLPVIEKHIGIKSAKDLAAFIEEQLR
jgi:hypothetical protein